MGYQIEGGLSKRLEWGPDTVADIALRHTNGERWAVHTKYFSPDNLFEKEAFNSFIAYSSHYRFQENYLFHVQIRPDQMQRDF